MWQAENHADGALCLGEMKGNRAVSGQITSIFTKWKMFFFFSFEFHAKCSHFQNELTVLCWLSQPTAAKDRDLKIYVNTDYINKCNTHCGALRPGINSSKSDWNKSFHRSHCLPDFSETEFSKIGTLFEISFRHKHLCQMGKFFSPVICFGKIVKYNFEKKLDPLHFKWNLPLCPL